MNVHWKIAYGTAMIIEVSFFCNITLFLSVFKLDQLINNCAYPALSFMSSSSSGPLY